MLTGLSKPSSGLSPINTAYTHENGDSGLQLFKEKRQKVLTRMSGSANDPLNFEYF